MSKSLKILVGTMTGTAELVAEEVSDVLSEAGWKVEMLLMDDLGPEVFEAGGVYLICSSTYGQGDVPDNGQSFLEALKQAKPDLSGVRYGVIALGDMTYAQTFCFGGKTFDKELAALGARRIGEPMLHNASDGTLPEDEAGAWAQDWAGEVSAALDKAA
ncbi:MAG: flavodoxin domain-containing protein [Rhodovibrionaceae bacterium]